MNATITPLNRLFAISDQIGFQKWSRSKHMAMILDVTITDLFRVIKNVIFKAIPRASQYQSRVYQPRFKCYQIQPDRCVKQLDHLPGIGLRSTKIPGRAYVGTTVLQSISSSTLDQHPSSKILPTRSQDTKSVHHCPPRGTGT